MARSDSERDDLHLADDIMLDLTGSIMSVSLEGERDPRHFSVEVDDGDWHHVCYQWRGMQHSVFVDGIKTADEKYGVEVSLPDKYVYTCLYM